MGQPSSQNPAYGGDQQPAVPGQRVPGKRKIKREVHLVNNGDLHLSVVDSSVSVTSVRAFVVTG